jgi:hypothetical protein
MTRTDIRVFTGTHFLTIFVFKATLFLDGFECLIAGNRYERNYSHTMSQIHLQMHQVYYHEKILLKATVSR